MELATSIVCEETEESVAQAAVMRLAAFGFGSVQNLAVSNPEDIDLATKDYEELAGASTTVKLFIRRLHFATQVFHPANETQGGGQGNTGDSSAPLNAAATTCAPFPREVLDSLRLQNQALERANKKPRKSNPHLGQDDDQSDDDVFDITGALDDAGLHEFHRPEHIEQKLYGAAKQACKKAHRKGRPWVSEKTSDLLHGFVPNASDRFDPDPQRANRLSQRKFFESFIHFYRHAQTWAFFHVAVGALSVSDAMWWLTDITELADARGEESAMRYVKTRLNAIKEDIVHFQTPKVVDETRREIAAGFLGQQLRLKDRSLEKEKSVSSFKGHGKLAGTFGKGDFGNSIKEIGFTDANLEHEAKPPRSVPPPMSEQICLAHNPAKDKICPNWGNSCRRRHLDTTVAEAALLYQREAEHIQNVRQQRQSGKGNKGSRR